jgi:KDO2-lipid IV(A) lauroyltransferase
MLFMKAKSGLAAWFVFLLVRTVFAIMQMFPITWNLRTARWLAGLWPVIMPRHRQRAVTHLRASLGDTYGPAEIERLADRCLESVAMFAVEAICLPRLINAFTWSKYIRLRDFDEALEVILSGRGAILVTGHYGSFEVPGHLLSALGYGTVAIMRPLDNVYLNRFVVRSRKTHGLSLLDKKGAAVQAERLLRDGKLLAFIGDQDAGRKGLFVEFFGQPASTYKSIGLLAMATSCPIIVGYARRRGYEARYEVGIQRIIHSHQWEQQEDPLRWITQGYTEAIEQVVRADHEQYLWIHRRWKSKPRKTARSKPEDGHSASLGEARVADSVGSTTNPTSATRDGDNP